MIEVFPNLEAIQNIYSISLKMNDEAETFSKLFRNKLWIRINSSRGKTDLFFNSLYTDYYKISLEDAIKEYAIKKGSKNISEACQAVN